MEKQASHWKGSRRKSKHNIKFKTVAKEHLILGQISELCFSFQDSEGFPFDIQITDNGDSTFFCVYIPTKPIKHTIVITWGDVNVPNSPFRVKQHSVSASISHCNLYFIMMS